MLIVDRHLFSMFITLESWEERIMSVINNSVQKSAYLKWEVGVIVT